MSPVRRKGDGMFGQAQKREEGAVLAHRETGRFVQDAEQGVEILGRCLAQVIGMVEQQRMADAVQPAQVAQAVDQRIPVLAEAGGQLERGRQPAQQFAFVVAAGEIRAANIQLSFLGRRDECVEVGSTK
jgi:hypothetical protein